MCKNVQKMRTYRRVTLIFCELERQSHKFISQCLQHYTIQCKLDQLHCKTHEKNCIYIFVERPILTDLRLILMYFYSI